MVDPVRTTYGELGQLLAKLGFTEVPAKPSWKAYRSADSERLVLLPNRPRDSAVRAVELASVRRHLVEAGLIAPEEFEAFLADRPLSHPSV